MAEREAARLREEGKGISEALAGAQAEAQAAALRAEAADEEAAEHERALDAMQRRTAQLEAELEGVGEAEARQRARAERLVAEAGDCLLYTSPSPRDRTRSRMPSSA